MMYLGPWLENHSVCLSFCVLHLSGLWLFPRKFLRCAYDWRHHSHHFYHTQIKTWSLPDNRICPSFASLLYVKSTILLELGDAPHACYCKPSLKGAPVPVSPHDFWFGDFSDVSLVFKDIFLPRLTSLLTPSDPSSDFWFKIYKPV